MQQRRLAPITLFLAAISGLSGCGSATEGESVAGAEQPFSTAPSEPNHEDITRAALGFLRPEILESVVVADVSTDVEFALVNANHFDDCNFSGGSQVVAANQAEAVRNLDPSLPPTAEASALLSFGRSLHTLQDFYAHSNWVELGGQVLVDRSLGSFPTLSPYSTVASSGFVVVQGAKPKRAALQHPGEEPYPNNAVVTAKLDQARAFGLISGTVDYEAGDFCPASVAMTHDELNKDKSSSPGRFEQFLQAKQLATLQTRHEWCRLQAMARAAWGDAGAARLAAWAAEGAALPDCTTE